MVFPSARCDSNVFCDDACFLVGQIEFGCQLGQLGSILAVGQVMPSSPNYRQRTQRKAAVAAAGRRLTAPFEDEHTWDFLEEASSDEDGESGVVARQTYSTPRRRNSKSAAETVETLDGKNADGDYAAETGSRSALQDVTPSGRRQRTAEDIDAFGGQGGQLSGRVDSRGGDEENLVRRHSTFKDSPTDRQRLPQGLLSYRRAQTGPPVADPVKGSTLSDQEVTRMRYGAESPKRLGAAAAAEDEVIVATTRRGSIGSVEETEHEEPSLMCFDSRVFEEKSGAYQIRISDPEVRSVSIRNRFTAYLVSGTSPSGFAFSSRKRYSDFEWLRWTLQQMMPGVIIPALPMKQTVGRFDTPFIEARRCGLQDFVVRIFNRPHLAELSVVASWLQRGEASLQSLKTEVACRSWSTSLGEYRSLVLTKLRPAPALTSHHGQEATGRRIAEIRAYLTRHLTFVKGLCKTARQLGQLHVGQFQCVSDMAAKITDFTRHEAAFCMDALGRRTAARRDVSEVWMAEKALRSDCPSGNFELLQAGLGVERRDTECMLLAVASVEELRSKRQQTIKKLRQAEGTLRQFQNGTSGNVVSSLLGTVTRRDRSTQKQEAEAELAVTKESVEVLSEWEALAFAVLNSSFASYMNDQVRSYDSLVEDFARLRMNFLVQETHVWKSFLREVAQGRAAAAVGSPQQRPVRAVEVSRPPDAEEVSRQWPPSTGLEETPNSPRHRRSITDGARASGCSAPAAEGSNAQSGASAAAGCAVAAPVTSGACVSPLHSSPRTVTTEPTVFDHSSLPDWHSRGHDTQPAATTVLLRGPNVSKSVMSTALKFSPTSSVDILRRPVPEGEAEGAASLGAGSSLTIFPEVTNSPETFSRAESDSL